MTFLGVVELEYLENENLIVCLNHVSFGPKILLAVFYI